MSDRAERLLREAPGGAEALERIEHIERSWGRRASLASLPAADRCDLDVVFAGGGLWITLAAYLARLGLSVAVVERGRAGVGHREWNISGPELAPLHLSGLLSPAEVDALVIARYRHGVCRWHGGGSWPVQGVLDHAVDGEAFLAAMRRTAEQAGVRFLDGHSVEGLGTGPRGARLRASGPGGPVELTARLVIDALGASSPHAQVDLGCPTVGAVLEGLAQGDAPDEVCPQVGDILVTTEHREENRQHIWEGFPGRGGALTTYLFYYARADALPPRPLLALYDRFFHTLPRYKRGEPRVQRLTYGVIPGWSRLRASSASPADRLLLVGDAAARHSPLTFCGFGSMVRSFESIGRGVARAIDRGRLGRAELERVSPELPLLRGVGALALLMAEPRRFAGDPAATNRLLDAAFASLHRKGNAFYASLLRDEMSPQDFIAFLYETSLERREVYTDVLRYLGPAELGRWALGLARGAVHA